MKATVKRALVRFALFDPAVLVKWSLVRLSRAVGGTDRRIVRRYLAQGLELQEPKLHVGCGGHVLDGWLNADLRPHSAHVLRMDATRRFPFPDNVFAYVYSEHVIEHLPFDAGAIMLGECFRVLAPGGKMRVATPDLAFLTALHRGGGGGGGVGGASCASATSLGRPPGYRAGNPGSSSTTSSADGGIGSSTTSRSCAGRWRGPGFQTRRDAA